MCAAACCRLRRGDVGRTYEGACRAWRNSHCARSRMACGDGRPGRAGFQVCRRREAFLPAHALLAQHSFLAGTRRAQGACRDRVRIPRRRALGLAFCRILRLAVFLDGMAAGVGCDSGRSGNYGQRCGQKRIGLHRAGLHVRNGREIRGGRSCVRWPVRRR